MYVGGGTISLLRGHIQGFLKVMKVPKSGSRNRYSLQADCFVFLAEYMCVGGGIMINSSNVPIKQIVRKLCSFKVWQHPSSSYEKVCLGTETHFLG